ncbi:type II toxin-antitoxin system VapC family toxin [Candidatus Bathyarchaeota archaeon]|nr:type II toxin-antitoxin system VapC family toxin [Candidatus Bathyarchaeota archaeon]
MTLLRLLREKAPDLLRGGSTISLAYYEVGNALWREHLLLRRITSKEASKTLKTIFLILGTMDVIALKDENFGEAVFNLASKLNITYYDASYLAEALKTDKTLVTDDGKLSTAARRIGVKTLTSRDLFESYEDRLRLK